ncbi:membrane protein [Microbacterium phage Fransoyer]|nr:membrane protein [Microbacterium phage Fransoyer]
MIIIPETMLPLTASDISLLVCFALATFLALFFALGSPRTWFRDRLGWVIFGYALATPAFVGLIAYAIVFGQPVPEPVRFSIGAVFAVALALKIYAIHIERLEGRLAGDRQTTPEGRAIMTNDIVPTVEEVKSVTTIWYKAQRVLRTIVQTVIPSFLGFAVVLPMIIEALGLPVESELRLWLVAVAAGVTAVAAAIARVMAIPAVNAWLTKIGLGSVPKDAVYVVPATGTVRVKADPKAERVDG